MSRKITLWKDPYNTGVGLFKKKTITLNPGVTVLVGCNGIGKTTFMKNIQENLKKNHIPVMRFDNLTEGGRNSRSESCTTGDFEFMAASMSSSEGENIVLNTMKLARKIGDFVRTGKYKTRTKALADAFAAALDKEPKEQKNTSNERWILLDAVDSGLSVDNIVDLKEALFKTILEYNDDKEIYIIVSANEYEMANGEACFDVFHGKYLTFKNYEEYRQFILDSRKWKEEREATERQGE
jgi:predicted ATPase